MWRVIRWLILITGLGLLTALVGAYLWVGWWRAQVIVHPYSPPVVNIPAIAGLDTYEDVTLTTRDGLQLAAWYVPPKNEATIILLHGLNGNREHLIGPAAMLANAGYGVLLLNFRNHGDSDLGVTTLGYFEVEDTRAALDYVLARPETDPELIGIFGQSMGGATGIRATAQMPEIRALVTESAFSHLPDLVDSGIQGVTGLPPVVIAPLIVWFAEWETGVDIEQVSPMADIAAISPRPVLLLHGERDALVPVWQGQTLYDAAQAPKDFQRFAEAHHIIYLLQNRPAIKHWC